MNKPKRTPEEHLAAAEEAKKHYHSQIAKINKQKKIYDYAVVVCLVLAIILFIAAYFQ